MSNDFPDGTKVKVLVDDTSILFGHICTTQRAKTSQELYWLQRVGVDILFSHGLFSREDLEEVKGSEKSDL